MLNRRDKSLLDKQLWAVEPHPPSLVGLGFVAVFVGGIIIGSFLFARDYNPATAASTDITGSIPAKKPPAKTPLFKLKHKAD
jgi:hypothetical protein